MNDWYTKTVLTVIALCLIALVFRDTEVAHAQGPVKVEIVGITSPVRGWGSGALPVEVQNTVGVDVENTVDVTGYVGINGSVRTR